ncbi:MAG: HAMP domain-containing protein [Candidatus Eisenbacteria bacterium]|uniref:histidine kinase n=1 Tax=Eiseniibacteriota bacterium TaxID=2212470 RepID=A0A933SC73_UNCEI|nr:HAMP domain-containing protein [Candidatus Eisenbacteria bacterium]
MTFRARLLVALLALALLPTLLLTLFFSGEVGRATERWHLGVVDRALDSSVEVNRTVLTRLEATLLDRADTWAAMGHGAFETRGRDGLRSGLRDAGLDFAQLYRRDGGRWRLAGQVVPAGVLAADSIDVSDGMTAALAGDRLIAAAAGARVAVARMDDSTALAAGVRLTPDFFARLHEIEEARTQYARLGVLVDVQRNYVWLLLAALVIGVAVGALLLARALSRQMTQPLVTLSDAFQRVAEGDLDTRVPASGAAELQTLAGTFNSMTQRLAEARVALARAERESTWRDVARQLAHEIKNPLTPMRLSLHRLQKRIDHVPESERAAVRDSIAALLTEIEHLTRLAEHFSQYARLPGARMEALDLATLARDSAKLYEDGAVSVLPAPEVPVQGDRLLLTRALHNLLLNAREAQGEAGAIELEAGRTGAEGWLAVRDRGPGLSEAAAAKLFEPYFSTKNRGSGLGLSVVKDIAERHGGSITLTNREGGGAEARLTMPLTQRG